MYWYNILISNETLYNLNQRSDLRACRLPSVASWPSSQQTQPEPQPAPIKHSCSTIAHIEKG